MLGQIFSIKKTKTNKQGFVNLHKDMSFEKKEKYQLKLPIFETDILQHASREVMHKSNNISF